MQYLALASCVKWEWPYLGEWIEYHKLVGVDHIFLYSNEEGEEYLRTERAVKRYTDSGFVTLGKAPGYKGQLIAYDDALKQSKGKYRWLAAHDLDEFLYPMKHDTIPEVLAQFEDCPAFAANWRFFGTAGRKTSPKSQMKDLLYCAPEHFFAQAHVKTVVQTDKATHFPSTHLSDAKTFNEQREEVTCALAACVPTLLRYNHYCLRSHYDFWELKTKKGDADGCTTRARDLEWYEYHDRNEVFDNSIAVRFGDRISPEAYLPV